MSKKVKKNYSNCSMFVIGLDMNCPLCGFLVKSGIAHECEQPKKQKRKKKKDGA